MQRRPAAPPVGVDDRVLNGVQRQAWLAGRPWLSAGQHQPVSRLTGADSALRREGGDPDTLRQLRRRRIETVIRVAQRVAAPALWIRCRWSANAAPRCSLVRPKGRNEVGVPPEPNPTSRRPSVSKSSTAASSATRSGFSIGKVIIAVPRRIRSVCAATWARTPAVKAGRLPVHENGAGQSMRCRSPNAPRGGSVRPPAGSAFARSPDRADG